MARTNISASWADTSLGPVLIARSHRGICAILFSDDRAETEADLARRFPRANLRPHRAAADRVITSVVNMIEAPDQPYLLPLDLYGTPFRARVWHAIRAIPPGETRSYGALARALALPTTAARAIAGACAANPLAVAVPCHRVVRADGQLSGYRWGLERKRALLRREGVLRSKSHEGR
ncbi:MAG: methylated-DNA--[protein]-cysteine S-methyltransferase [Myxococcota bacterium]